MNAITPSPRSLSASLFVVIFLLLANYLNAVEEDRPRLLFLVAHGFNRMEHFESLYSLTAMGYQIDVASFERGSVLLDPKNERNDPDGRDAFAQFAMREITDISPYLGLVIPGGYSAGNLEKEPEAIRIVRAFNEAQKPIGSICHGARLLAGAGVVEGKVVTGWNEIPNEIPDTWQSGAVGIYIDQEVVVDGHIISCRYPNDVGPWLRVFNEHLVARGGITLPQRSANIVLFARHMQTSHQRQMTTLGTRNNNVSTTIIFNVDSLTAASQRLSKADAVFVYPNSESKQLLDSGDGQKLLAALNDPPIQVVGEGESLEQLRSIVAIALEVGHDLPSEQPTIHDAVIALSPGFDERVVIAMEAFLRSLGFNPVMVSHERGWVRGLQGLPVFAAGTYTQPPPMTEHVIVVAPGGLWPREDPEARQAVQPTWLTGQAELDARRAAWITQRYKDGGVLITFGFDSLYVTADEVFTGISFAASDQTVWSFRNHSAGQYARDVQALRSADRIFSARGFEAVPELMRLLQEPAAIIKSESP